MANRRTGQTVSYSWSPEGMRLSTIVWQGLSAAGYLCVACFPQTIDSHFLRGQPMLKLCLGWQPDGEQDAASQSGVSRLMTQRSQRDLKRLFTPAHSRLGCEK